MKVWPQSLFENIQNSADVNFLNNAYSKKRFHDISQFNIFLKNSQLYFIPNSTFSQFQNYYSMLNQKKEGSFFSGKRDYKKESFLDKSEQQQEWIVVKSKKRNNEVSKAKDDVSSSSGSEDHQSKYQNERDEIQNSYEKISTNYPFSREYVSSLFRQKDIKNQRVYSVEEAQNYIIEQMDYMINDGYDFRNQPCWDFQSKSRSNKKKFQKKMKRKLYIRLKCKNCKDETGEYKKWTSILGTGQIKFMVDDLAEFLEKNQYLQSDKKSPEEEANEKGYPFCVRWYFNLYRMKCTSCLQWGQPYIYETQLEAFAKSFCIIIAQIVEKISDPRKKHKDKRNKIREVHKHEESLCEACQKGECFNIPKGQQGKQSEK